MESLKTIFCAYQGPSEHKANENVEAIRNAVKKYNKKENVKYRMVSWEMFPDKGRLPKEVLEGIDNCSKFICDLTYFNHNVLFELGYAIAKNKDILILLHKGERIQSLGNKLSTEIYKDFFGLWELNYHEFSTSKDIVLFLNERFKKNILEQIIPKNKLNKDEMDLFYFKSIYESESAQALKYVVDCFKDEKNISVTSDNLDENKYQAFDWYCRNIYTSSVALFHLISKDKDGWFLHNAKISFFAGLALGFDNRLLLVSPKESKPPLDYRNNTVIYESSDDVLSKVNDALNILFPERKKVFISKNENYDVLKLGLGYLDAESEEDVLLNFFIETNIYHEAINKDNIFICGKKGSGKTAVYIKLKDYFSQRKENYIVNLFPEPEEILENIDIAKIFSKNARRSFFSNVWKHIIYSRLFNIIYTAVISDRTINIENKEDLKKYYESNKQYLELNYYSFIRDLYHSHKEDPTLMEKFVSERIKPLVELISNTQIFRKEFNKIYILADGLDRAWRNIYDLELQSEMIISLFDINNKISRDLGVNKKNINKIIFLRSDIIQKIMHYTEDSDKKFVNIYEINWSSYLVKLKEMLEQRFRYLLNLDSEEKVNEIWTKFFKISIAGKDFVPFDFIKLLLLPKPRDYLFYIRTIFSNAYNNSKEFVSNEEISSAIYEYKKFIFNIFFEENSLDFPELDKILELFRLEKDFRMPLVTLLSHLRELNISFDEIKKMLLLLMHENIITCYKVSPKGMVTDNTFMNGMNINNSWFFRIKEKIKPSVFLTSFPEYQYQKLMNS